MELETLGWDAFFDEHFAPFRAEGLLPARVVLEHQHLYRVHTGEAEVIARVAGRFRHRALARREYPAVGDWVAIKPHTADDRVTIRGVVTRKSRFSRKVAGELTEEQVVAANIDTVFLVTGLDHDFNTRRIERYLVTAWEGGASPVIVLNKADLCTHVNDRIEDVNQVAPGVPVHAVSSLTREGLDPLARYLEAGHTVALLGSSGVGKSTIINRLVGADVQRTREVRLSDSRGRHTTTSRELVVLPDGGLLIDTPGMRELQLWETGAALQETFDDVTRLGDGCHFPDCRHDTEPRCAVKAAVEAGELAADRLESFRRLQREAAHMAARQDERLQIEEKRKVRTVHRAMRRHKPRR